MPYAPLEIGPLYASDDIQGIPRNMRLTLSQNAEGFVTIRGDWKGMDWFPKPDAVHLTTRATEQVKLDAPNCHVTHFWNVSPGGGPHGKAEFICLYPKVVYRDADSALDGAVCFHLHGLNCQMDASGMISIAGQRARWRLTLVDPEHETAEILRKSEGRAITAILTTDVAPPVAYSEDLAREAKSIAWLLSLAMGRSIQIGRSDLWTSDGWPIETRLRHRPGRLYGGTPSGPLPFDDVHIGPALERYVTSALPRYTALESTYRLNTLIHWSLLARRQQPLQATALICVNFLEILRHAYGANVLVPTGRATPSGDDFCSPTNPNRRMSFAEIMQEFCNELLLTGWEPRFKDLRNQVVHQGTVPGNTPLERRKNVMDVLHFCDRALLALLEAQRANLTYYRVHENDYQLFQL